MTRAARLFDLPDVARSPCGYSAELKPHLVSAIRSRRLVLDPFAGDGGIHEIADAVGVRSIGVEIESEHAHAHRRNVRGSALTLPFPDATFDAICTSPTYGDRHADTYDRPHRNTRTYRHALGHDLHPDNSGQLHWGPRYRAFHEQAWPEVLRVLTPRGRFVLNIADHIRGGARQHVTVWHVDVLTALGLAVVRWDDVPTPGFRYGANRDARVGNESVIVFDRQD